MTVYRLNDLYAVISNTLSDATVAQRNGGPSAAYRVYQSASLPVYDAFQDVKKAAVSIQMDTRYELSADLTALHDHAIPMHLIPADLHAT